VSVYSDSLVQCLHFTDEEIKSQTMPNPSLPEEKKCFCLWTLSFEIRTLEGLIGTVPGFEWLLFLSAQT
jgi:hypothetical protein